VTCQSEFRDELPARRQRLITPADLVAVKAAKNSGTWDARKHVEDLIVPPDLEKAIKANPEASRYWVSYSASRRKGVLYRLAGAKRPETRARYLQDIIENIARNMSHAERMEKAGFRAKPTFSRRSVDKPQKHGRS
jgi:uncharacterized protein YdeI (YjbR/CyaY-like superfamily)